MIVLDESGNEIGRTYPKRAKGLIKNGRARFIDETTICLACPPEECISEDEKMNSNTEETLNNSKANVENSEFEFVKVHLDVYLNGMEVWHNQVQILLEPKTETGKNVLELYSTDIPFELSILEGDDVETKITLKPSTLHGENLKRGLALIRFTPCVAIPPNQWIPRRGEIYSIAFKAVGTDGITYVSDRADIVLYQEPVINGIKTNQSKNSFDFSSFGNPGLTDRLAALSGLKNQSASEQKKPTSADVDAVYILQKIDDLENNLTARLKTVIEAISEPEDDDEYEEYLDTIKSVTVQLVDAHDQTLAIYRDLAQKLSESSVRTPRDRFLDEQFAYIKSLPSERQRALFPMFWSLAYRDPKKIDFTHDAEDDEDGEE